MLVDGSRKNAERQLFSSWCPFARRRIVRKRPRAYRMRPLSSIGGRHCQRS